MAMHNLESLLPGKWQCFRSVIRTAGGHIISRHLAPDEYIYEIGEDGIFTSYYEGIVDKTKYWIDDSEPVLIIDRTADYDPESLDDEYDIFLVEQLNDSMIMLESLNFSDGTSETVYSRLYMEKITEK